MKNWEMLKFVLFSSNNDPDSPPPVWMWLASIIIVVAICLIF
jgi:hypothetical protein